MAHFVLTDARLWLAQYDLSGDLNVAGLDHSAEIQDDTTFTTGTFRAKKGGLKNTVVDFEGFWNGGIGNIDEVLFNRVGVNDVPCSLAPTSAEGSVGYGILADVAEYNPGGEVGAMFAFNVSAEGSGQLARGRIFVNRTATASGNSGTAIQMGAVGATQKLYAALHVLAASGTTPTLDVTVRSDDASGFGTPTTRITFAQATAASSQWATPVAGLITDDWWRIDFTIGGVGPSFTFVVFAGIA